MQKNTLSKSKQLDNLFNSLTEDIFNASEKEIDEMLVELGYDPKKVGDSAWELIKNLQKLKGLKNPTIILKPANEIEVWKQYYWQRRLWKPEYSGMVTIVKEVKEMDSNRTKGWRVRYVNDEQNKMYYRHLKMPEETYSTFFAGTDELFEAVNE